MLRLGFFIFFTFLLLPLGLISQTTAESSNYFRTPVLGGDVLNLIYYTKIGVGTFDANPSFRNYFLAIDTGSSLIWLQCEECRKPGNRCFPQLDPPFPNSHSYTYAPLSSCNSQNHATSRRGRCIGELEYEGGERTRFELAHDHFTLETNVNKSLETVKLEFGCGIKQTGFNEITKPGIMTGILGLSRANTSLHFQIDTESGTGVNFSYCFPILKKGGGPTTYLTFGKDIPQMFGMKVTPLLLVPGDDFYYVKMFDIVVNGHPLHIDPSVFDIGSENGGVILDTGSSISHLIQPAYDALEGHLTALFSGNPRFNRKAVNGTELPPLCYNTPKRHGYKHLPTIKLILQDAEFVILPRQGFYVGKDAPRRFFCLMMRPSRDFSVIGAYQQVNHRFVYDSAQSKLLFKRENCAKHH